MVEMGKRVAEIKDLKVGKYVLIDNEPCRVVDAIHSKPGKHGGAKARIEAVGVFDNQKRSLMGPVDTNVEVPIINKRNAQILNVIGNRVQLMDMESYETFELEKPDDFEGELAQGANLIYMEAMGKRRIMQMQG